MCVHVKPYYNVTCNDKACAERNDRKYLPVYRANKSKAITCSVCTSKIDKTLAEMQENSPPFLASFRPSESSGAYTDIRREVSIRSQKHAAMHFGESAGYSYEEQLF